MKTIRHTLLLGALVSLLSCSKEDTAPLPSAAKTQQSFLQDGEWRMVGYLYEATLKTGGAMTAIDYFSRFTCQKDDLFSFKADKSLLWNKNSVLCENSGPSITTWSTWDLTANDTQLILNHEGYNVFPFGLHGTANIAAYFDVVKLTKEEMVLKNNVTRAVDSVIVITYTFVKN